MTSFQTPADSFSSLDPADAATLVASAADIALVLDAAGTVRDLSVPNQALEAKLGAPHSWIGQAWAQLLNQASRAKAALLLAEVIAGKTGKWHHLNHSGPEGDVPVLYAGAPLRQDGRVVLFGRDLRPLSLLQQRLIDTQQSMERDHIRLRQLELRYRTALQTAPDPLLVANAATQKIVEINPALASLVERGVEELAGQPVQDLFAATDRPRVAAALNAIRASNHSTTLPVTLVDGTKALLSASLFREDSMPFVLVRLAIEAPGTAVVGFGADDQAALLQLVEQAPDGYVVTDASGQVLAANAAFLSLAEISRPGDLIGQSLDRWLGRSGVDMDVLLNNLRQRGIVRLFSTALTASSGLASAVEISAVALAHPTGEAAFGFAVRDVERRVADSQPGRELPRSVDQLTELIGRVALKDLVREATDMIERLCIEAALEKTSDNRASAAELLGLSRQSLYVKLHRYGLGDLADAPN